MISLALEDFSTDPKTDEPQPASAWELGYAEGFAAGRSLKQEQLQDKRQRLLAAALEQLRDISFTHEEARRAVLEELSPCLTQIFEHLVPEAVKVTLADRLALSLKKLLTAQTETLALNVPSALLSPLKEALKDLISENITLLSDPNCTETTGQISIASSEWFFDPEEEAKELVEMISSEVLMTSNPEIMNGHS